MRVEKSVIICRSDNSLKILPEFADAAGAWGVYAPKAEDQEGVNLDGLRQMVQSWMNGDKSQSLSQYAKVCGEQLSKIYDACKVCSLALTDVGLLLTPYKKTLRGTIPFPDLEQLFDVTDIEAALGEVENYCGVRVANV